jgi:hypothetical protein
MWSYERKGEFVPLMEIETISSTSQADTFNSRAISTHHYATSIVVKISTHLFLKMNRKNEDGA